MAIINSIVVEKAHGKIGNVVFNRIAGQDLAKQLPESRKRKSSPLQVTKQEKLSNTYKGYSLISLGLRGMKHYRRTKENIWNCFARNLNQYFTSDDYAIRSQCLEPLMGVKIGYNATFDVFLVSKLGNTVTVSFNHSNDNLYKNKYLLLCGWSLDHDGSITKEIKLTTQHYNQKYVQFDFPYNVPDRCMVYAYTKNGQMCSTIQFRHIVVPH